MPFTKFFEYALSASFLFLFGAAIPQSAMAAEANGIEGQSWGKSESDRLEGMLKNAATETITRREAINLASLLSECSGLYKGMGLWSEENNKASARASLDMKSEVFIEAAKSIWSHHGIQFERLYTIQERRSLRSHAAVGQGVNTPAGGSLINSTIRCNQFFDEADAIIVEAHGGEDALWK